MAEKKILTLFEIVNNTNIELGQVLVPISAFGYTYERLQTIFLQAIRRFQRHYPYEDEFTAQIGQFYLDLPENCNQITLIRHYYSDSFRETNPKLDRELWEYYENTNQLFSEVQTTGLIRWQGTYKTGYFDITARSIPLLSTEDVLFFTNRGHFKRGSLVISLDEGEFPESVFTADPGTDLINLDPSLGELLYTGKILHTSTDDTLPAPLLPDTDYYVIKVDDSNIRLALSRDFALANTFIDITTPGTGTHTLTAQQFTMTEDLLSYNTFTSSVTFDDVADTITTIDRFADKVATRTPVTFTTDGTLPAITGGGNILPNVAYYLVEQIGSTFKLAPTQGDAITQTNLIDFADAGTGNHTISTPNSTIESVDGQVIDIVGTLGEAVLNLDTMETELKNLYGLSGNININFISNYLAVEGLDLDNEFFFRIFKQKFCTGVGKQKTTVRIEGLPFDVSTDELATSTAQELEQQIQEDIQGRETKWYLFG
jgi:hypothetical protein